MVWHEFCGRSSDIQAYVRSEVNDKTKQMENQASEMNVYILVQ